ncbi:MAG: 4-hydroxy-tetrahydrodipicolinate reductase [Rhizobiaceae bacterium]|nr:4-hydroxy-tetrahydrodipicolinate reductase [Rhizobiaceae bacterium]
MSDMKLVIVGAGGRMGRSLVAAIDAIESAVVSGAIEQPGSKLIGQDIGLLAGVDSNGVLITDDAKSALQGADGIVDFTVPAASCAFAEIAASAGIVHVIGTTGCTEEDDAKIKSFADKATIVKSGNMSLGVNLLAVLVEQAAKALDSDFDIEVLEMHHKRKIDAPSGTALLLGEAAAKGRDIDLSQNSVRSRDGITGAREDGTIGFATLRGGSVIGEHSVIFAGDGERIELSHIAQDRSLFAKGAIKAALWARNKPHGYYSMRDVLGI